MKDELGTLHEQGGVKVGAGAAEKNWIRRTVRFSELLACLDSGPSFDYVTHGKASYQ